MLPERNWQQQLVHDLDGGMARRINCIIKDRNLSVEGDEYKTFEFQYYGKRTSSLVQGMRAATDAYHSDGSRGIEELKEQYSGDFADGVEIGAKTVVSSDSEFTFTHTDTSEDSESETNNTSSFTFTQ
jgi:hypothetical protein